MAVRAPGQTHPCMIPAVGKPLESVFNRAAGCSKLKGKSLTKPELF